MKRVCSWCDKVMEEDKEAESKDDVSHGMCPDCEEKFRKESGLKAKKR